MKEWYTALELAKSGLVDGVYTKQGINQIARNDNWKSQPSNKRGGGKEFHISSLPMQTQAFLALEATDGITTAAEQELKAKISAKVQINTAEQGLAKMARLPSKKLLRATARLSIVESYKKFAKLNPGLTANTIIREFVDAYNSKSLDTDEDTLNSVYTISERSLQRWLKTAKEDISELGGKYGNRRGSSLINKQEDLRLFAVAMLTTYPHMSPSHMLSAMTSRFDKDDSITLPSEKSVARWIKGWLAENKQLASAIGNPDAWKNKYMLAMGSVSEDISRINQMWEFDGTPADVMLKDGRHALIGEIDVYSRRAHLHVSKTNKSTAVASSLRRCLLDWGVPEVAKTDNGADYVSKHVERVFSSLQIEHNVSNPFSPWEKPHIERFFRTFSHDFVELLPNYIGHNVADRNALTARQTFAERMFKKNSTVEINMTSAELQKFCDEWVDNVYMQRAHSGLNGRTPASIVAASRDHIRVIEDERALDLLLSEAPSNGGMRTVLKKGINVDNYTYIHEDLGMFVGERVRVLYDPEGEIGKIYVFGGEHFEFICEAIEPSLITSGITRREVAIRGKQKQKAAIQDAKKQLKAASKKQNVKGIVDEMMEHAKSQNKVTAFPNPNKSVHTTPAIESVKEAQRHIAPITDEIGKEVVQVLEQKISAEQERLNRFTHWLKVNAKRAELNDLELHKLKTYESTPEFMAMHGIYEEFGSEYFEVKED